VTDPRNEYRKDQQATLEGTKSSLEEDTVDGCEILHQLIGGKHPIIFRVSTILLVVQDFATIHLIS
jgi:hypothetical protein